MARGVNIADLAALPNDATLVAGQEIAATEHGAHRRKVQGLANNMLTGLRDKESGYAGAGAPIGKRQGKVYFDTDDSLWKGYKTSAGTPQTILESALAYAQALATAGTATFKVGGAVNVDTANSTIPNVYTMPADTLSADGKYVVALGWGSYSSGADRKIVGEIALAGSGQASVGANATNGFSKVIGVRTGANAIKVIFCGTCNRDDTGSTALVATDSATPDTALSIVVSIGVDREIGGSASTEAAMSSVNG